MATIESSSYGSEVMYKLETSSQGTKYTPIKLEDYNKELNVFNGKLEILQNKAPRYLAVAVAAFIVCLAAIAAFLVLTTTIPLYGLALLGAASVISLFVGLEQRGKFSLNRIKQNEIKKEKKEFTHDHWTEKDLEKWKNYLREHDRASLANSLETSGISS